MAVLGTGAATTSFEEIENTDVIIAWGSNTPEAHPIIYNHMRRGVKNGAKLIVIDPRKINSVKIAEKWLPVKIGADIALANAMGHVIIEEGLHKKDFIKRSTLDFELYKKHVENYTPEYAETITGIPADDIREVARLYAKADKAIINWTLGITEHHNGSENVFSLINLALLTGHIGKYGSGLNPLRGQNNVQGAGDVGASPNVLTGGWPYNDPEGVRVHEEVWGKAVPKKIGKHQTQMFEAIERDEMKALYVIGENPLVSDADSNHVKALFEKLEFLVVQDIFMTNTAKMADVVLPAGSWAESEGTFINSERRVQRVRKLVESPGKARMDHEIVQSLANHMGENWNYDSAEDVWEEIRKVAPNFHGMTYERIEELSGIQFPCKTSDSSGTKFLHERLWQENVGKKAPFMVVNYEPPVEMPDFKYPLQLTTGRRLQYYNTGVQTNDYKKMRDNVDIVEISSEDATVLGISNGDTVTVESRRGKLTTIAKISDKMPKGVVFMAFHFPEKTLTNSLTIGETDPLSGTAEFKASAVRITKI